MQTPESWLSVVPPLVAITLAILTQRVVLSLLVGVFSGALVLASGQPLIAIVSTLETFIWPAFIEEDHLRVFAFTLLMGAMVEVIRRSGGMHGIVTLLTPIAQNRLGGQLVTWMLGLIIFFDDYANTLLLGTTMRPLCDRLKISREKLAYIVDSTAAPVAGLAIVSTWIAGEIDYINTGFSGLTFSGPTPLGFEVFIATIPYRFYVLWSLLLVPLIALTNRDFGPMLAAERRALKIDNNPDSSGENSSGIVPASTTPQRCTDAIIPVVITVGGIFGLLMVTGQAALNEDPGTPNTWVNLFGAGNAYIALLYGSLAGLLTALILVVVGGSLTLAEAQQAALDGARLMLPALAILLLAWSLSKVTSEEYLSTGLIVGEVMKQLLLPQWMPTLVFVLAGIISFCTGTSWGTMGILMPLVIQTTHQLLAGETCVVSADHPILIASIGSVLAGAIFGDHCSPISDTTILSSQASGCAHIAHVRTQLPYAFVAAIIAITCGTIPIGFGFSILSTMLLGPVVLLTTLYLIGRKVE